MSTNLTGWPTLQSGFSRLSVRSLALAAGAALLDVGIASILADGHVSVTWLIPAGLLLLVASFVWWRQAVYLVFALLLVEGFFRNLLNTPYVLLAKDAVLAIIYLRLLVDALLHRRNPFRPSTLNLPLAVFSGIAIVQIFNPNSSIPVGLVGLQTLLFNVPLLYVAYAMFRTQAEVYRFLLFLLVTAGPLCALGIMQFIQGPQAYAALGPAFSHATFVTTGVTNGQLIYRPNSSFAWPSHFSSYLSFISLLLLASMLIRRRVLTMVAIAVAPLVLFMDLLSGQRSLYVLLPASMLLVVIVAGRKVPANRWLIVIVVGCIAGWLLTLNGVSSVGDRLASIILNNGQDLTGHILAGRGNLLNGITASPIGLGTGAGALGSRYVADSIPLFLESFYGEMAAELSVLGLAAFLWLSASLLYALVRAVRRLRFGDERAVVSAVLAIAILDAITNSFANALDLAVTSIFLWFLTGLALRLSELVRDAAVAEPSTTAGDDALGSANKPKPKGKVLCA